MTTRAAALATKAHQPDPTLDLDETLGALTDLIRAGKIRYAGSSKFPAEDIVEAQWVAERRCVSGRWRADTKAIESASPMRNPARFDLSLPGNQRKLVAVEALSVLAEQTELSLIHLALAFVLNHPAGTAPIIGPRTMEHLQSQLGAGDVTLNDDVLDRIDEIVPPGTTLLASDRGWTPPALSDPAQRRRRPGSTLR